MAEKKNELQIKEKTVVESVMVRVKELEKQGAIEFPSNYSYQNALTSAKLSLSKVMEFGSNKGKSLLEICSQHSIANALLDMVTQGLTPVKNQCYFIPYGTECTLQRSYMGTVAVAKRFSPVIDVKAYAIYDGDNFETEFDSDTGILKVKSFAPSMSNINAGEVIGAFCIVLGESGVLHTEVMTIAQIRKAWNQGAMKGGSPAHKNFTEEMAKKTVINRALKLYINTSDDSELQSDMPQKTAVESAYAGPVEVEDNDSEVIDIEPIPKSSKNEQLAHGVQEEFKVEF